ncbi:MAG: radical SAM protein [Elusimicrobiales bacterium]
MLKPKNCEVILNYDCNAKCKFCYHPDSVLTKVEERMPLAKAAEALYKGRRENCWVAYLIGGEITMRPDLPKIVRLARGMGYPYVQVMSNGLKFADPAYARELVEAGANIFRVSVHGPDAKTHDSLVGVPGAFGKVMKAFENLTKLGAEISVNHALNKQNYKKLKPLLEIISGRFGIEDFNVIFPHYNGMMAERSAELGVSVTQAVPYVREALAYLKDSGAEIEDAVLVNFTPCNLPEAVHLMAEWERPTGAREDEPLFHIDGKEDRIHGLKERLCLKNKGCASCVYNKRCMGFEKWYSDLFGSREFRPVRKAAAPFPLKPSHNRLKRAEILLKKLSGGTGGGLAKPSRRPRLA